MLGGGPAVMHIWDWDASKPVAANELLYKAGYDWFLSTVPRQAGGVWIVTRTKGIFGFDGKEAWVWPGSNYTLKAGIQIECLTEVAEDRLAIGTSSEGILVFNTDGTLSHTLASDDNDTVDALAYDKQGGLWASTRAGITRYEAEQNTLVFDRRHGIPDTIRRIVIRKGRVYLATESGTYRSYKDPRQTDALFRRIPDTRNTADLALAGEDVILGGENLWLVLDQEDERYSIREDTTINCILLPESQPDVMLAGSMEGTFWAVKSNGVWEFKGRIGEDLKRVYGFAEAADGAVWCSLGQQGIHKIIFTEKEPKIFEVELPDSDPILWYTASQINGKIYLNTAPQTSFWDPETESFQPSSELVYYGGYRPFGFEHVFAKSREDAFIPQSFSNLNTIKRPSSRTIGYVSLMGGFYDLRAECILIDDMGAAWIGTRFGLVYERKPYENYDNSGLRPKITRITDLSTNQPLPIPAPGEKLVLSVKQSSIGVEVAYQSFRNSRHHSYFINLEGRTNNLAANTSSNYREFTNLRHGEHNVSIQAVDSSGKRSDARILPIEVQTPFSKTTFAYVLYGLAAIFILALPIKLNSARHIRQKQILEKLVEDRTKEISEKNEQLQHRAEELSTTLKILKDTQQQLLDTARKSGKSQVASDVVHEIGQSLNSVNTSIATLNTISQRFDSSRLYKISELLTGNKDELYKLLQEDPRGKLLPVFIEKIALSISDLLETIVEELAHLEKSTNKIQECVSSHQSDAQPVHLVELTNLSDICAEAADKALKGQERNEIVFSINSELEIEIMTDRAKVLDILKSLLTRASRSISELGSSAEKEIKVTIGLERKKATVSVIDTGIGFTSDAKQALFSLERNADPELHRTANYASSLGGKLDLTSQGTGKGSVATLTLPLFLET